MAHIRRIMAPPTIHRYEWFLHSRGENKSQFNFRRLNSRRQTEPHPPKIHIRQMGFRRDLRGHPANQSIRDQARHYARERLTGLRRGLVPRPIFLARDDRCWA